MAGILLIGMLAGVLTGCGAKKVFYSDATVDSYAKSKFPGAVYVSQEEANRKTTHHQDVGTTYVYEDEYGRQFHLTTAIEYADDLSGQKIEWMQTKSIENTYEKDIFSYEKEGIAQYLEDEQIEYEIKDETYASYLYLYLEANDENSVRHMAEVFSTIDREYLRFNKVKLEDKKYSEKNLGECYVNIRFYDSNGKERLLSRCNEIRIGKNSSERLDEEDIYSFIWEMVNKEL